MKTVYLGGGCFWCTEAAFQSINGVTEVVSGYMGGDMPNPTYEAVCSGTTNHAEVVKVTFDESMVTLDDILDVFFEIHDPTTPNRQGNDVGTQYRSIIFYTSDDDFQSKDGIPSPIQAAIHRAQSHHDAPIVTHVAEATEFYPAEEYHQNYYAEHSNQPYCQVVISPKLEKLQKKFAEKMK